jgi:hypothetical protein
MPGTSFFENRGILDSHRLVAVSQAALEPGNLTRALARVGSILRRKKI